MPGPPRACGWLYGWVDLTVTAAEAGTPAAPGTPAATPTATPTPGQVAGATAGNGSSGNGLAATGAPLGRLAAAALVVLLAGAGLVLMRRCAA